MKCYLRKQFGFDNPYEPTTKVANKEQCYKSDKWCIEVEDIQMLRLDQMYTL
jgi:hypothetical protein